MEKYEKNLQKRFLGIINEKKNFNLAYFINLIFKRKIKKYPHECSKCLEYLLFIYIFLQRKGYIH